MSETKRKVLRQQVHMIQRMVKIKNRIIVLPRALQNAWANAEVFARVSSDTVVLKKIRPSSFWDSWENIKSVKPKVSKQEIEKAILWARNKQK